MELINIKSETIKEYLGIKEEFTNIEEFCEFLLNNEKDIDIKLGLKQMLIFILKDNKQESQVVKKNVFKKNVEWIRQNCYIGELPAEEDSEKDLSGNYGTSDVIPENDFEKLKNEFESTGYKNVSPLEYDEMDYSEGIILHEGGIITQQDEVQINIYKKGLSVDVSKMLVIEEEGNQVMALGHLIQISEEDFWVIMDDKKCIDYNKFKESGQVRFVIYDKSGKAYSRIVDMDFKPFAIETERPLCIDFGTSNTTVGSYGIKDRQMDKPEIVHFIDVTVTPNNTKAVLLPTVVYVEDCSDINNIKYLFGYEARKKIEDEHYESKASVYYEIKRWISSIDEREEIRDNKNHKAYPLKRDIIKAYLDYVIENAEQYFGTRFEKLHFTAPVKLKNKFIDIFSGLYKDEKHVMAADKSIDEGVAIVYNQIITLLYASGGDEDSGMDRKKSIMIMDCGGGTTDLASCEYSYEKKSTGMELVLETCFENGNSNFGGNNITYRIMQLLKIKIAALLKEDFIDYNGDIIQLIDKSENDILGMVERKMQGTAYDSDNANIEVYAKFLENYQKAETIIPTQYAGNKIYYGTETLKQIKRNFYYLWRQAEQIKIDFYKTERVLMDFKDGVADTRIHIENNDNYYLYIANEDNKKLKKQIKPFQNISITINEINRVICGDIYSLLVGLFQNGELTSTNKKVDSFDYYKLSGQSCKISLFSELIKEYIPGRKFRPAIEKSGNVAKRDSEDLKLDCVLGSINYIKDQMRPEMNIITNPGYPEIIYNVVLKGQHTRDKKLFDCTDINTVHLEVSHENTKEYPIKVITKDGSIEREFMFQSKSISDNDELWNTDDITKKIGCTSIIEEKGIEKFIEELRKTARDKQQAVNIVFVVPAKDGYGVYIGQIYARSDDNGTEYRFLKYRYENFEDVSKTFFDGKR